jgi:Tfp pilus assembly protein PilX
VKSVKQQRGAVLMVSLVMLVLITLFVVSSLNLSMSDLRIVGNLQSKMALRQGAQQAIETVLSNANNFTTPTAQTITVNGIAFAITTPKCLGTSPAQGYTAVNNITLYDTLWLVSASATDTVTGASATIDQGVAIRLPTNYCP